MSRDDSFYIGWEETAQPAFGRRARLCAVLLLVLAPVVAVLLAASQDPFDDATFEFGEVQDFEGVVRLVPYPVLEVSTPEGDLEGHWLLVAFGKHGAGPQVADFADRRVRLRGTLVYRGDGPGPNLRTMVEVEAGSVEVVEDAGVEKRPRSLGRFTLRGEIVDSKCWLGVMKPGQGKAHRACASLCIRGGIPPMLALGEDEDVPNLLLLGSDGEAINDEILHVVAEPVEISGDIFVEEDVWTLHADLDTLRRLAAPDRDTRILTGPSS